MFVFYLAIFCSLLFGLQVKQSGFYDDFLDRNQTDAIKGLFTLIVLLSHSMLVIRDAGFSSVNFIDKLGYRIHSEHSQLVVVMFLFYSGYGVMEAIRHKGQDYLDHFPRRRILTTLLNFDIAVLCFIGLNLLMGVSMDWKQIGRSFIAWDNVGNSDWYIFVILYCYLVTWISGKMFPRSDEKIAIMTVFLVLAGEAALSFLKHGQVRWYNTILCYAAGVVFSLYKETITGFFRKNYFLVLGTLLALLLFLHHQKWIPVFRGFTYNAKSIVFALLIVLVTMKVKTGNRFLRWTGMCLFPIYIYQRLPMRAFVHWAGDEWVCSNPYVFTILCAAITGCIALFYKYWQIKLR